MRVREKPFSPNRETLPLGKMGFSDNLSTERNEYILYSLYSADNVTQFTVHGSESVYPAYPLYAETTGISYLNKL